MELCLGNQSRWPHAVAPIILLHYNKALDVTWHDFCELDYSPENITESQILRSVKETEIIEIGLKSLNDF